MSDCVATKKKSGIKGYRGKLASYLNVMLLIYSSPVLLLISISIYYTIHTKRVRGTLIFYFSHEYCIYMVYVHSDCKTAKFVFSMEMSVLRSFGVGRK